MSDNQNMDTSPETEADTASGGAPEQPDHNEAVGDRTGDAGAPSDPGSTDDSGAPVDNPAG
jgi:hypothetical protein